LTPTDARRRGLRSVVAWSALAACAGALLLRWTLRDSFAPLAFVFYAAQPILLAIVAAVTCVFAALLRRWRLAGLCAVAALAGTADHIRMNFRWTIPAPAGDEVRVLHWNVASGRFDWDAICRQIVTKSPDVVALSEAWPGGADIARLLRRLGPGYAVSPMYGGLCLLVRGELLETRNDVCAGSLVTKRCRVRVRGREFRVLQVDVPSSFTQPRYEPLASLERQIEPLCDGPLIVVGDMNCPPDSVCFDGIRRLATEAYEVAGRGYRATWPSPLPILAIDQMWSGPGVRAVDWQSVRTTNSDHSLIVAEFMFEARQRP
jgi:vancomycin resistance protein VanJ